MNLEQAKARLRDARNNEEKKDRQTDRQRGRQTDRQTERQADRQTKERTSRAQTLKLLKRNPQFFFNGKDQTKFMMVSIMVV